MKIPTRDPLPIQNPKPDYNGTLRLLVFDGKSRENVPKALFRSSFYEIPTEKKIIFWLI